MNAKFSNLVRIIPSYNENWILLIFVVILQFQCQNISRNSADTDINLNPDSLAYYTHLINDGSPASVIKAHLKRARLYYKEKAYSAALKDLRLVLQKDSMKQEAYILKSNVEMDYFRSMEALRTLQKAEKLWPLSVLIKEQLAQTYLILKRYDQVREMAGKAIAINPLSARPYLILGIVAKENRDTTAAIQYFKKAIQNDADLLDGWIELARIQMNMNPAAALPYFKSALQIAPEDTRIWHVYAVYWQNQDSLSQAKNAYDHILSIDSQYLEAYFNKALILMDQDSFREAIPLWNQYISKSSHPDKGYYYRGISYEMAGDYTEALANYKSARQANPDLENIDDAIQSMIVKTSK